MTRPRQWTDERIAALRDALSAGLTLAEAGKRIGASLSAVAGACQRYGIKSTDLNGGGAAFQQAAAARRRGFLLGRDCQYIAGTPHGDDACKCGRPVRAPGAVYCADHHARCHSGFWSGRGRGDDRR